ncbi:MAG: hypothetical protein GEV06_13180 [Luteitalea sp.]|nr:hypothetical protein [Luteitalea sp.]
MVLGPWSLVLGPWSLVLGSWLPIAPRLKRTKDQERRTKNPLWLEPDRPKRLRHVIAPIEGRPP